MLNIKWEQKYSMQNQVFVFVLFFWGNSQVNFIYIALFTIQIVQKQLHSGNMKIMQQSCIIIHLKYGRS